MTLKEENGNEFTANQYEGHTSWIGDNFSPFNYDFPIPDFFQQMMKKFVNDQSKFAKADVLTALGFYGNNPNVAKRQVNTNAPGGRAAAKSLFRKLSKGQKIISGSARDGSIRRYTENGSVQIRMKSDGTTNVDIQGPSGKEDVHFQ